MERAFTALVLVQTLGPMTGGYDRALPVGLEFAVMYDPLPVASAVAAKPTLYEDWELILIDEDDRLAEKYGGYHLVVPFEDLDQFCARR